MYVGFEEGKLIGMRDIIREVRRFLLSSPRKYSRDSNFVLLLKGIQPPVLIFVQSKDRARELFNELLYDGINVDIIHSERTQKQVR